MAKFRKKPIPIDAWKFEGTEGSVPEELKFDRRVLFTHCRCGQKCDHPPALMIASLEGPMVCRAGDYVVRGVVGDLYPCRSDIFEQTYEAM